MALQDQEGSADEVELPALRKALVGLGRQVDHARACVVGTIEAKHADFVASFDQIGQLETVVSQLQQDLLSTSAKSGGSQGSDEKLQRAVKEHASLEAEARALDSAAQVLRAIVDVQQNLDTIDDYLAVAKYGSAAKVCVAVSNVFQCISAPEPSLEPPIVQTAKTHFYQRRALLLARLDAALSMLVEFGGCKTIVRSSVKSPDDTSQGIVSLSEVWEALNTLSLRDRRAEQLAVNAQRLLLRPMFEAARKLQCGCVLKEVIHCVKETSTSWTWVEEASDSVSSSSTSLPAVQSVLPALGSLLHFVHQHWAGGSIDAYRVLGCRLWPMITRSLLQHFDICGADGGSALEQFELQLFQKGFMNTRDTLSKHVQEYHKGLHAQRRASLLGQMRAKLMQEDTSLVEVFDNADKGSTEASGCSRPCLSPLTASSHDGFFRLPRMQVSNCTHKLVAHLGELVGELESALERGRVDEAKDINKLVRDLCTLFCVLRPFAQKAQLRTDARCGAVFLADCMYLVHTLIRFPYTFGVVLAEHERLCIFVDLVPQLRRLGEQHYSEMIRWHQDQLVSQLRTFEITVGISKDRVFVTAEAALGSCMQQLRAAVQGLSAALPQQLLEESTVSLLGSVCARLVDKLLEASHLEADDLNCASTLLAAAVAMGRAVLDLAGVPKIHESADGFLLWEALQVCSDLLGSNFARFLERRTTLLHVLSREEAVRLMRLSLRNEGITAEDAWDTLSAADRR